MPRVRLVNDTIQVGRLSITFQRTLRIPDDGNCYPLPPGLGAFPMRLAKDFGRKVPAAWRERGGYFIPMYQREALWMSFNGEHWRPNAWFELYDEHRSDVAAPDILKRVKSVAIQPKNGLSELPMSDGFVVKKSQILGITS